MKRIPALLALLLVIFALSGCQLYARDYKEDVLEYAMIATNGNELEILDQYPNLEYVDLRGSTCYEDIISYSAAHPDVKVRFSIALGTQHFNHDITDAEVGQDASFEDLMKNLKYFRFLKNLHIDQIGISKAELDELKAAYPKINITYSVKIGDDVYEAGITELNIAHLTTQDMENLLRSLEFLPKLTVLDLMDNSGKSNLTLSDVKQLVQAYPQISYNYTFKLFGLTLSSADEKLVYKDTVIGISGLDQIRDALTVMPNCTYVCLDNCSIADEEMAKFRDEQTDVTVVWRVFVDDFSVLTDTEVILMQYTVNNRESEPLQYCTNVKYLDLSGCNINDFSFLASMPNLECAVLTQTYISDLSVLENCKNLTWLDLANCTALKDISSLSELKNLKYLNLSATKVKDLSPLDKLSIERFKCVKPSFNATELSRFQSKHPKCLVTNTGSLTGKGWRYEDTSQRVPFTYYSTMVKAFGYDK